ncbi:hypothetical protein ACGFY7_23640 [Streptomyces prunicolor]|uniref:hypothetical protein n=1 Tax=Streptomyces prunicolor TaxID=67348 RepID=UPI00372388CF
MDYPFIEVSAYDVTNVDARASVQVRFDGEFSLPGVTQQDVVDAVKAAFSSLPNVTVSATQYEVTSSTV